MHHPKTIGFKFETLVEPLVRRYGSMRKLIKKEIGPAAHRLERDDTLIYRERTPLDNQRGQKQRFSQAFWDYLDGELRADGDDRMPAGAQFLLADAIVNWALNYIEQR